MRAIGPSFTAGSRFEPFVAQLDSRLTTAIQSAAVSLRHGTALGLGPALVSDASPS